MSELLTKKDPGAVHQFEIIHAGQIFDYGNASKIRIEKRNKEFRTIEVEEDEQVAVMYRDPIATHHRREEAEKEARQGRVDTLQLIARCTERMPDFKVELNRGDGVVRARWEFHHGSEVYRGGIDVKLGEKAGIFDADLNALMVQADRAIDEILTANAKTES